MSNSKNKSLTTTDKLLVELNSNALLFATNGKRIYNLVVTTQTQELSWAVYILSTYIANLNVN